MSFEDDTWKLKLTVRLENMRRRPLMYAATVEGYVGQIWLLLELLDVDKHTLINWSVALHGNTDDRMGERLTAEEAERISASAMKLLGK